MAVCACYSAGYHQDMWLDCAAAVCDGVLGDEQINNVLVVFMIVHAWCNAVHVF